MSGTCPVVIVGAGHGGFTVADTLRQLGYTAPITLIDAQDGWPYQRPPLSKTYLGSDQRAPQIEFRANDFYGANGIDYQPGARCVSIDPATASIRSAAGRTLRYRHLVLATGAQPRTLPVPGADLEGVCPLHTRADAGRLVAGLSGSSRVVIVGGGFIGLEVASAAQARGLEVTVVEAASRLMQRSVSAPVSQYFLKLHRDRGVTVLLDSKVTGIRGAGGRVVGVELSCGRIIPADVVIVGVGVRPRTELALEAGLAVDDGIVVDEYLKTSEPDISAVGDCAAFPNSLSGIRTRLESVQNATDQARCVAARLTGDTQPYRDTPWFWSHQGGAKLQIAGLAEGAVEQLIRGDPEQGQFSVLHLDAARTLVCGESVNSSADHVALRTLVSHGTDVGTALHEEPDLPLKGLAKTVRDKHRQLTP